MYLPIMTTSLVAPFLAGLLWTAIVAQGQTQTYPTDAASVEHAGVPKGELLHFTMDRSVIFPGTKRDYFVYIPAQYQPEKPACVYVNQDGVQWNAPTVFDNLIQSREMPVTIGIFVQPGRVIAEDISAALDRFNRSFEYDGIGDGYVRFLLEELLPEVERQHTADGRPIRLSHSGNDRAIGGSSSGAVCAFTAAWQRPEAFTRVFSAIGTYVGLRGADRYPILIRKYEPKPIRVFLQDGSNDLNIYGGDWYMANQTMERALVFAGYDVRHVWGEGGHSGAQGTSVFPEAMRWLWKDWPRPVGKGGSANQVLHDILIPGKGLGTSVVGKYMALRKGRPPMRKAMFSIRIFRLPLPTGWVPKGILSSFQRMPKRRAAPVLPPMAVAMKSQARADRSAVRCRRQDPCDRRQYCR